MRKYRFKNRADAEAEVHRQEQELHLHRIALDALLREEFTFTRRFTSSCGTWFKMGLARTTAAHGGLVLVQEYYPTNLKPSQRVEWADTWVRQTSEYWPPCGEDDEAKTFWKCFYALRAIYNQATRPPVVEVTAVTF